MNGDSMEIMQAIQGMESRLSTQIGDAKSMVATALAQVEAEKNAREALRTELLGPGGRVVAIEESRKEEGRWERAKWLTGPVMVVIHGVAHKFGVSW